jgi:hypothetical protein
VLAGLLTTLSFQHQSGRTFADRQFKGVNEFVARPKSLMVPSFHPNKAK